MALLSKEETEAILKKALSFSKADECELSLGGSEGGNIRYARNAVSTAGENTSMSLSVSSTFGKQTGNASINEFDTASLEKAVRRSEELARLAPPNPEFMPALGPQGGVYKETKTYIPATAAMTPDARAEMVAKSLQISKENKLEAAGFLENSAGFRGSMNSKGLFLYNRSTDVSFSVTLRNQDGTGSGYAEKSFNDVGMLDTLSLSKVAAYKAVQSASAKAIEPGKYTVILEPLAAADFMGGAIGFDARSAEEGRSILSKKGGGTKLGEQMFSELVTIYTDPFDERMPGSPFNGDGMPNEKIVWVDKGVIKTLAYSRYWAEKKGVKPTGGGGGRGGGGGVIFAGGSGTTEDLIKSTEKGILVTRFWYIRSVDQQTGLVTGLTRDGTFYIENGKIKFPVKNFRFNESPIIALNNVEAMGASVRQGRVVIPPMKIRDFTFTSLSDAV